MNRLDDPNKEEYGVCNRCGNLAGWCEHALPTCSAWDALTWNARTDVTFFRKGEGSLARAFWASG